jgi:hypothetical protein
MKRWSKEHTDALIGLYREHNVPSDSLVADAEVLDAFTQQVSRRLGGTDFADEDVAKKLFSLRKAGRLPRLQR